MSQVIFLYGNQPLQIREERQKLIQKFAGPNPPEGTVFHFDAGDFVKKDQATTQALMEDFRNSAETVSFFSSEITLELTNLQLIPSPKSPTEALEKQLKEIHLYRLDDLPEQPWVDADSLKEKPQTHHHVTGLHLVEEIKPLGQSKNFLRLAPAWQGRTVFQQRARGLEGLLIEELLAQKCRAKLQFEASEVELAQAPDRTGNAFAALLVEMVQSPPEGVTLLLSAEIKNLKELNQGLRQALEDHAQIERLIVAYDDFRPLDWLIQRAKQKGLRLEPPLADLMIDVVGSDFTLLDSELEKLALHGQEQDQITPEILLKQVSHSKSFSLFRVASFLMDKDLKNSLESLEKILKENHQETIPLFGLLASNIRRLLKVAYLQAEGLGEKAVAQRLGLADWLARQLFAQAKKFQLQELENILVHLAKQDLRIKFAGKEALPMLEQMVFLICQGGFCAHQAIRRHWV